MDKRVYLFDLDGTIINSYEGISKCVRYALDELGYSIKEEEYSLFVGPPLNESFKKYAGMDNNTVMLAVKKYRELYVKEGIYLFNVYEGVEETLKILRNKGYKIAVATSKPEHMAKKILRDIDLDKYFDVIGGSISDTERSKKVEVIRYVLDALNVRDIGSCVLIGDTIYDLKGANELGMDCIIVDYGFGSDFTKKNSYMCIEKIKDLLDVRWN